MEKEDKIVRQTVRFPREIYEAVEAARGTPGKSRPSFNGVLMDLIREALEARAEKSRGNTRPTLRPRVYLAA